MVAIVRYSTSATLTGKSFPISQKTAYVLTNRFSQVRHYASFALGFTPYSGLTVAFDYVDHLPRHRHGRDRACRRTDQVSVQVG